MSPTSWHGQIYRVLQAIDYLGHSKYEAKQAQGWQPGQPVYGLYSFGYKNLVFDRAITFTNWLRDQYPHIRLFREVDNEMTAEYLNEKAARSVEYGQALRFILSSGARINEALQLRADKVFLVDGQVNCCARVVAYGKSLSLSLYRQFRPQPDGRRSAAPLRRFCRHPGRNAAKVSGHPRSDMRAPASVAGRAGHRATPAAHGASRLVTDNRHATR